MGGLWNDAAEPSRDRCLPTQAVVANAVVASFEIAAAAAVVVERAVGTRDVVAFADVAA